MEEYIILLKNRHFPLIRRWIETKSMTSAFSIMEAYNPLDWHRKIIVTNTILYEDE